MEVIIRSLFILCTLLGRSQSDHKRLLLSDPDVLNARLGHLAQALTQMNISLQQETALRQAQDVEIKAQKQQLSVQDVEIKAQKQQLSTQDLEIKALKQQLSSQNLEIKTQKQQLSSQDTEIQTLRQQIRSNGASYVRWGRKQCPHGSTELVYSGFVGGQQYYYSDYSTRFGGPANTLCLPQDPELSNVTYTESASTISGSEYERDIFGQGYTNRDVPCSVCRVVNKTSAIIIPGRRTCYQGWTEEYHGILASGARDQTASMYICMDGQPEYVLHGEADQNGNLFYPVKYNCGSLPCPPYRGDRMVECVVCSK